MKSRVQANQILTYREMCDEENMQTLQRGMNFRLNGKYSVLLMCRNTNAPYPDRIENGGTVLIYEGHDAIRNAATKNPKAVDQPESSPNGTLSQNGLFHQAAQNAKMKQSKPELVRVYEKIRSGIWADNGFFDLVDSWREKSDRRHVFKFKLVVQDRASRASRTRATLELKHERVIPSSVKAEVWKRDKGQCVVCGATDNLHFDHNIPFSKGGSSLTVKNIQLMCARHNLAKRDKIQ